MNHDLTRSRPHPASYAIALAALPYFIARGWLNAWVVLLGLAALFVIGTGRTRVRTAWQDRSVRLVCSAFMAQAAAVLLIQAIRHEFAPSYLDGPLRFLLAAFLLLWLVQRRLDAIPLLSIVLPVSVLLCAAMLLRPGASAYFWGDRVASYFMDPITLAQHVMIVGFLCLFLVDAQGRDRWPLRALKLAGFGVAVALSIWTESRSGWVMAPLLFALFLVQRGGQRGRLGVAVAVLASVAACVAAYAFSAAVHLRVDEALSDAAMYFQGQRDTSIGIRISLYRAVWILFSHSPLTGWGFVQLPDLARFPQIQAFSTPLFVQYFEHNGSHNEFLQAMLRMGVVGLVARLLVLGVPLLVFFGRLRTGTPRQRVAAMLGLCVVVGYLTAGMTSEVFNLVYTSSFYALLVATFAAMALADEPPCRDPATPSPSPATTS